MAIREFKKNCPIFKFHLKLVTLHFEVLNGERSFQVKPLQLQKNKFNVWCKTLVPQQNQELQIFSWFCSASPQRVPSPAPSADADMFLQLRHIDWFCPHPGCFWGTVWAFSSADPLIGSSRVRGHLAHWMSLVMMMRRLHLHLGDCKSSSSRNGDGRGEGGLHVQSSPNRGEEIMETKEHHYLHPPPGAEPEGEETWMFDAGADQEQKPSTQFKKLKLLYYCIRTVSFSSS